MHPSLASCEVFLSKKIHTLLVYSMHKLVSASKKKLLELKISTYTIVTHLDVRKNSLRSPQSFLHRRVVRGGGKESVQVLKLRLQHQGGGA